MLKFVKAFLGLKKVLSNNSGKEKIIFYSESNNYRNYFQTIFKKLLNTEKFLIQYVTSDINDLEEFEGIKPIYIGNGFFQIIFFTVIKCKFFILTLTNLGNHHLKKSKNCKCYIYIFHSLVSTHKCYEKNAFINYDAVFTVGNYQNNELKKTEEIYRLPQKKIFNVGYFYTEYIKNKVNLNLVQNNNIILAPSWNRNKKNLFNDFSLEIIKKLISLKFNVTLRTHPEILKRSNKKLNQIKQEFGNDKFFNLNSNLNNFRYLENSKILITDDGGVGLEYAYIFKRPVIFFDYVKKIHNENYNEVNINPIEEEFKKECGYIINVSEISDFNNIINKIEKDPLSKINNYDNFFKNNGLYSHEVVEPSKKALQVILNDL